MRKSLYLLILFSFLAPTLAMAKETKEVEAPTLYKKDSLNHWEWLYLMKRHINPLQTVPLFTNENLTLEIGPAQFQITFPF